MLRNPNSIPSTDTLIQDPAMEPFFITRSQTGGFTVYERVVKGENNTEYIKTISYPSNFGNALKTVTTEIVNEGGKTYNLKNYVERWESVKNSLLSIVE
jgi:hypothetical protein|tara:strand:+ start:1450 stop:1746 length:297 start_codon:yes stop_codon:yes gene_type:complete